MQDVKQVFANSVDSALSAGLRSCWNFTTPIPIVRILLSPVVRLFRKNVGNERLQSALCCVIIVTLLITALSIDVVMLRRTGKVAAVISVEQPKLSITDNTSCVPEV